MMIVKFELIKSAGRELGYDEKKLLQFFRSKKKNEKHFTKFHNSILLSINIWAPLFYRKNIYIYISEDSKFFLNLKIKFEKLSNTGGITY